MKVAYLDIETLPEGAVEHGAKMGDEWDTCIPEHLRDQAPTVPVPERGRVPRNLRDPAKIEAREQEIEARYHEALAAHGQAELAAQMAWWRGGALDPARGRVACISVAIDGGDVWSSHASALPGDDEADIIEATYHHLVGRDVTHVVSWGDFDSSFLFGRCMRLQAPLIAGFFAAPHYSMVARFKLYNRVQPVNAMDLWPLQGGRRGPSLADACAALGIDHGHDNPITGAEVLDAWMAGRIEDVIAHCEADVRDLRAVWRALAIAWGIR